MNIFKIVIIKYCLFLVTISLLSAQVFEKDGIYYYGSDMQFYNSPIILNEVSQSYSTPSRELPYLKNDFMVNSLDGEYGAEQRSPNMAIDSSGNYAIAWVDSRNGEKEIYAQFFNNKDERVRDNILVSEVANHWNSDPAIAANKKGDFIIAWAQEHNQILAQRFSKDGAKLGDNFQLNSIRGWNTMEPSIALTDSGYFTAVWTMDRAGGWDWNTYARIFNPEDNPICDEIVVNDTFGQGGSSIGWGKRVAVDGQGNFAVVWSEHQNGKSRIFLQMLDKECQKQGSNITISDTTESDNYISPAVSATDDGHFLIFWENHGLHGRIYHKDGYFVSEQFNIYQSNVYGASGSIASDRKDRFVVFWKGGGPSKCQQISTSGEFLGDAIILQSGSADSLYVYNAIVSNIINSNFYITFAQYQINDADILIQKYDLSYNPENNLVKVNDDLYSSWQTDPLVYYNKQGDAIVLWQDRRHGRYDLFAQVYDNNMNPVGENIQINNASSGHWFIVDRNVSAFSDGTFLIAFSGSQTYHKANVYLQKVSPRGQKIGLNKLIKENYDKYNVNLQINDEDQVLLCWYESGYYTYNAFCKKFNKDLSTILPTKQFIKYNKNSKRRPFSLSINDDFDIFATWLKYDVETNEYNKICGLFYNEQGNIISDTIIVESFNSNQRLYTISNLFNTVNDFIVTWFDSRKVHIKRNYTFDKTYTLSNSYYCSYHNYVKPKIVAFKNRKAFVTWTSGKDVYGCFINDNKQETHLNILYQFEAIPKYWGDYFIANSVDLFKERLFFVYESAKHGGTGYDIWANIQQIDDINFEPEIYRPPFNDDFLYPNFPNPFNSRTTIAYRIYSFHKHRFSRKLITTFFLQ